MKRLPHLHFIFLFVFCLAQGFYSCGSLKSSGGSKSDYGLRKLLLRDEGLSRLSFIDIANPIKNWYETIPPGRDLQLVGNGLVMIGTGNGYEEREVETGKKTFELASFKGALSARRLSNGNTLLTGVDWQEQKGVSLVEVSRSGEVKQVLNYPSFSYVRLVRETPSGTYLITADDTVFESDTTGSILWKVQLKGMEKPHAWQALRLKNGTTAVSTGFLKTLQVFSKDGALLKTIAGPEGVHPHFFAGFQVMPNGNYVVTNWQGHGDKFGASGIQLLQFTPGGKLAWSWKQDPGKFSSLQGVIVLDGLDISRMHVENEDGVLTPVR